jgi:AcrR family transcriptional regulator
MSVSRRRTYLRADDRRAQILDVAKQVFATRGYHEANVEHICKAARIGRGTLYQYFDNKRDVLLAVVNRMCERVERVVQERPKVAGMPGLARAPREMIVAFSKQRLRALLAAVFEDEATLRLLLRDARGADGMVDEILARIDALVLGACEGDMRAARAAGLLRDVDPRVAALHVLGGVEKVVLAALAADDPVDLDAIVGALVDLQLFGLLNPEVS